MDLRWTCRARAVRVAGFFFLLIGTTAVAQSLPPALANGVAWLRGEVQVSGALQNESTSIGAPLQAREESEFTLQVLDSAPSALVAKVAADTQATTEFAARRLIGAASANLAANADLSALLATQNSDGGWGINPSYQSNPLDTALALQALRAADAAAAAQVDAAVAFLARTKLSDGGWGVSDRSSVYVTSHVLLAAQSWAAQNVAGAGIVADAGAWLVGARDASQQYGNAFDNASALIALAASPSQSPSLAPLANALNATQLADGSWADDPYVTALALRGLWLSGQVPITPTNGKVLGLVVDQASNVALVGATVQLAENAAFTATTSATGSFQLSGVPQGSYTLNLSANGYSSRAITIDVVGGQTLNVGTIGLAKVVTTASVYGTVRDNTGAALKGVLVAVGTRSVLTDSAGAYQLDGIPPGTATVSASLTSFQTASASVAFVANTTYRFSPTLYPLNTPPPATSLQGRVIDAASTGPIAGASVTLNGSTQTTAADGSFRFNTVAAGAFVLAVSANGYQTVQASGSAVAGANDVGAIALSAQLGTSTLQGKVLDANNAPIANATIAVVQGPSATTDNGGAYLLAGLTGTQFTVQVSATGYIAQTTMFSITAPGSYAQDFHLVAQQTNQVTLGALTVAPPSAGANADISVSATLFNGGSAPASGVLLLEVYDASNKIIGSGPLTDTNALTIGAVTLPANASLGIIGRWNTGQFAPGAYQFELRFVAPGSISRSNPLGTLIQNQFAPFAITPTTHFAGTVAANPPVVQAGTNQSVDITAAVKNDGNGSFPTQALTLIVADSRTGTVAFTTNANVGPIDVNGLASVDFGSWLPASGGNFNLIVSAADSTRGRITGTAYVGNVAQSTFAVTPDSVVAGTRTVHGKIHITGVDPTQATVTDPLAPLIRAAIGKAVTFNDGAAHAWIDRNQCSSCHIGNQALLGGELTLGLANYNALDRSVVLNNISSNQAPDGGIWQGYYGYYAARLGSLSLWGLLGYHDQTEFTTVYKRAADWVAGFQNASGEWYSDYNAAWFDNDISMAMLNISNLHKVDALLKSQSLSSVPTYTAQTRFGAQPSYSRGSMIALTNGNLLYSDIADSAVHEITSDGVEVAKWTGFNDPRGLAELADAQLWVASAGGSYRLNADGSSTKLSTLDLGLFVTSTDRTQVYGLRWGDTTVYKLDANGVPQAWISPGPTSYAGYGASDSDGNLYIPDFNNGHIYRVAPDKTVTVATELIQGYSPPNLWSLLKDGDGWLLSTSNGVYHMGSAWQAQRLTWTGAAGQLARLADNTVVFTNYQVRGMQQLVQQSEPVAPSLARYAHAIDVGAAWLQAQKPNDSLHMAQKLWGLGEAYRYFLPVDATRAASIKDAMAQLDAQLRARQNADGGWGYGSSDALVTAQTGIALDYLNPSPSDPAIRKAVTWLLTQQQGDGSWFSANGIMSTHESTTTMVAIWLPTILDRLGAIDVQASATFPQNIQASAIVPAPTSTATDAAGKLTAMWQLTGVTVDGRDLDFDLTLDDMQPNEVRAVASDAHLAFANSFTQSTVTVPIAIPNVSASGPVSLTVVTDQPAYPANATAQVTTTLANIDIATVSGDLAVDVYDASGELVGPVSHQGGVAIPPQGTLPVTAPFAIGTIAPATYTVKATLRNGAQILAQGTTHFEVLADNGGGATATSTLHTDKQIYNPNDSVQILSGVISQSANVTLSNLSLSITVVDANGVTQFTRTTAVPQLAPSQTLHYAAVENLSNAAPGSYTVKQDLLDAQNNLLNHVETAYNVSSSGTTGFGLAGTIVASPKALPIGATLTLTGAASNNGNAALDNLPLTITIVDPDGVAVTQFTQTSSIAIGASVAFVPSWTTQGSSNTTYTAVLSATLGTNTITLASDTFTLTTSLKADVKLTSTSPPLAALVLLDPSAPASDATRLTAELAARNYVATFVATAADFDTSLRSGAYSLYLLLADVTLQPTTQRLLREAVHRGEGLLVASGSATLPDPLAQASGLTSSSALLPISASSLDALANAPGGMAYVVLNPTLAARVVASTSAQTEALFTGRLSSTPTSGTLAQELALLGRIDIGYFGNDAGCNNTQLALFSSGRIKNGSGSDIATVWLIRNSGNSAQAVTLKSVAGSWSLALTIAAHTDTFVTSPIVAGTANHVLLQGTHTLATVAASDTTFADTRLVDVGANPGAIALWANHLNASGDLQWDGAQHELHGAIHSNSDIAISGAQNIIDGPVHYVTTFVNNGSQNTFTYQPRQVAVQPLPTLLDPNDYKPGGAVAHAVGAANFYDATAECTSRHVFKRNPNQFPLPSGVYWVPCDVQLNGSGPAGTVTMAATGTIQISGSKGAFTPYYGGVNFVSTASGTAMHYSGSSLSVGGFVYAPNGLAQMDGSAMTFNCAIVADTIRLSGSKTVVDARHCAQATVEEKTPAVLRNTFGAGGAAYAPFAWPAAIDRYETTPGELTHLFEGVLGQVAPTQMTLRGGSIVPLTATVTRVADPFTGSLAMSLDDNGALVPPSATWALDFMQRTTLVQSSNVRLGSGTSTTVSARVAALTPIKIDPLAQTSLAIPHLASDAIVDLITAANAIANPDAGISAAIVALNAAKASQASGDAAGMLGHLLDAAEASGTSSNVQADALRTRVDWVIWGTTH